MSEETTSENATVSLDVDGAIESAHSLLESLGVDLADETLSETPKRMAMYLAEFLNPLPFDMTTFPNDEGYDELVLVRDIAFHSLCEHHVLPFSGVVHIGYIPGEKILGLSKFARVVENFSRTLQIQERLTSQIGNFLQEHLQPKGLGVVIEAEHTCMTMRDTKSQGTKTVTSCLKGLVRSDERTRAEFFSLIDS